MHENTAPLVNFKTPTSIVGEIADHLESRPLWVEIDTAEMRALAYQIDAGGLELIAECEGLLIGAR
jgi:hypothetical protein